MTLLAHISDVHFGREDGELVEGLLQTLHETAPDVIIVSGDLTQRARKSQFRRARAFLEEMPAVPRLVVPGNHDVSATNLLDRLARPLKRYKRFITPDLCPFLAGPEYAVAGINTVRLLSRKDGRINGGQVREACERLSRAPAAAVRVVVTHHPMDLPMEDRKHALVVRAPMAMKAFSECRVDLFLSGHLHAGQTVLTSTRYGVAIAGQPHYSAVVAQAGTAVSTRTRGEANGWNLIRMEGGAAGARMSIEQMVWSTTRGRFQPGVAAIFERRADGWIEAG